MAATSSITALFNCLLLLSIVTSSIAASLSANIPESDLPFEFNHDKGSVVVGDNLLTQAVSSDGKTVFSTNSPQPIKKYQSTNINNNENSNSKKPKTQTTNPYYQNTNTQSNKQHSSKKPQGNREENFESTNGVYSTHMSPIDLNQWNFIEHISKLLPGVSNANVRIIYI